MKGGSGKKGADAARKTSGKDPVQKGWQGGVRSGGEEDMGFFKKGEPNRKKGKPDKRLAYMDGKKKGGKMQSFREKEGRGKDLGVGACLPLRTKRGNAHHPGREV